MFGKGVLLLLLVLGAIAIEAKTECKYVYSQ